MDVLLVLGSKDKTSDTSIRVRLGEGSEELQYCLEFKQKIAVRDKDNQFRYMNDDVSIWVSRDQLEDLYTKIIKAISEENHND